MSQRPAQNGVWRVATALLALMVAAGMDARAESGATRELVPAQQGQWQQFWLPKSWLRQHAAPSSRMYLLLAPPHPSDLASDFAPCWAPSRLLLGRVDESGVVRETLLECLDLCRLPSNEGGSLTYIDRMRVAARAEGIVAVELHLSRRAFQSPQQLEQDARPLPEGEGRWLHREFVVGRPEPQGSGACGAAR